MLPRMACPCAPLLGPPAHAAALASALGEGAPSAGPGSSPALSTMAPHQIHAQATHLSRHWAPP